MKLADLQADRDQIRKLAGLLDDKLLRELYRRSRYTTTADGAPTSLRKQPSNATTDDTSTEAAALRRLGVAEDRNGNIVDLIEPHDPIGEELTKIVTWLRVMAKTGGNLQAKIDYVLTGHLDEARDGYCQGCERYVSGVGADPIEGRPADRIQSGWCHTCYVAWTRAGKPERHAFALTRRVHNETAGQP